MIKAHGGSREATSSPDWVSSPEGARFHSRGRSPGKASHPAPIHPNGVKPMSPLHAAAGRALSGLTKCLLRTRTQGCRITPRRGYAHRRLSLRERPSRREPASSPEGARFHSPGRSPGKANHSAPIHPNGVKPMSPFHAAAGRALSGLTKCLLQTQTLGCRITPRRGDAPRRWAALGKNPSRHQDRPHGKESR